MTNGHSTLRAFGNCRLDIRKKLLWDGDRPVQLPLKVVELLCVLVEGRGAVLTKGEIWQDVWNDTFVEETNLTHNIYLLRKALKDLGHGGLIETIPRRGYRFSGEVFELPDEEIVLQRHALTRTTVEIQDAEPSLLSAPAGAKTRVFDRRVAFALAFVVLVALLGGGVIWRLQSSLAHTGAAEIRSIAVLPLRSLNESADDKLLSRGIADALITSLGSVNKVRVISTDPIGRDVDAQKEPSEIGREVSVDSVLDGTFQKANGKLRVTLRLIRTSDGAQIWNRSFDESETEIFRLQDAIAGETARSLKWNLSDEEQRRIAKRYTEDHQAYEAYLRGRFFFDKRTHEDYDKAVGEFEQAIRLDPNYALAIAGLADVYALQANYADSRENRDALYERSRATAIKALQLDETLAEGHTTLAWIRRTHDWDWAGSEAEFKRALELNPNYVNAHQWYALLLTTLGRWDEALTEIQSAHDLEPLSKVVLANYFGMLKYHDLTRLPSMYEQIKNLETDDKINSRYVIQMSERTGDLAKAIEAGEDYQANHKDGIPNAILVSLAIAYSRTGETAKAEVMLDHLKQKSKTSTEALYRLAEVHGELGHKDEAIALLQKCLESRDDRMVWLKVETNFDSLRNEPRFRQILGQMNLPG